MKVRSPKSSIGLKLTFSGSLINISWDSGPTKCFNTKLRVFAILSANVSFSKIALFQADNCFTFHKLSLAN